MRNTCFALLAACLSMSGCNGCDGDHPGGKDLSMPDAGGEDMAMPEDMTIPDDAQKLVTYTTFASDYAKELCAHYMMCGQLDAAQLPACIERETRHLGWDADVEIMKGRVALNELQCLDAIKNSRCDNSDSAAWNSRCAQFLWVPKQANGQPCLAGQECMSGFCKHAGSDAGAAGVMQVTGCPGTCQPVLAIGDPCRLDGDCGAQAWCDVYTTQQCQPLGALNDVCASSADCQFGLLCPTYPAVGNRCVAPTMAMLDGDCDPFQGGVTPTPPCSAGLYCQVQYDASSKPIGGKCKTKLAASAACDPKNEGGYGSVNSQCADGTICYTTTGVAGSETCHAQGGLDQDCNAIFGTKSTCKQGLWCDTTTTPGKCKAYVADGATCIGNKVCSSALPGQDTCIADAPPSPTTTCQPGKSFGVACKPGVEDSLCAAADNAGSAYCADTGGGNGSCAPKCF